MKKSYYYVPCDGGFNVNEEFRHYFRLYEDCGDGRPILLEQGNAEIIKQWESKYPNARMSSINPYPHLD